MEFSFVFAQVSGVCTPPNPFEWVAIIALISGAGILSAVTGTALIGVASTIVTMLIHGASISAIVAAISADTLVTVGGTEALTSLIISIMSILGC